MMRMVKSGQFREDLYYRLNVFPIEIPPLRERPMDIEPLVRKTLEAARIDLGRAPYKITQAAMNKLIQYSWPGNVRELENVLQRAMILANDSVEAEHIDLPKIDTSSQIDKNGTELASQDIKALERKHILETLAAVNGSRKLAVKRLGISERTLRYKLQQYRMTS